MFTLIFIAWILPNGATVLTQAGFYRMEDCNKAGEVMVERLQVYTPGAKIEWVCK